MTSAGETGDTTELFDPYDAAVQEDPYPIYRVLRDRFPVYRNKARAFWALTRYDDVVRAAIDYEAFSSEGSLAVGGVDIATLLPMMIMTDPPRHDHLRTLVNRAFTARRVRSLEHVITSTSRALAGALDTGGDLVAGLAAPLPIAVITRLLGMPDDDAAQLRRCVEDFVQGDPASAELSRRALDGARELYGRFDELVRARRRSPQDDLVSALTTATVEGRGLEHEEILGFCFLLIVAGTETATNLITNAAVALQQNPDVRRIVVGDRVLLASAIEETLRHDGPVQGLARVARREVELHGVVIPEGAEVLLVFGSANRDERVFEDPDRFDLRRGADRHLAFGLGAHYCLGASLARLEASVALSALLERMPEYELDVRAARRLTSSFLRGYRSLPIAAAS